MPILLIFPNIESFGRLTGMGWIWMGWVGFGCTRPGRTVLGQVLSWTGRLTGMGLNFTFKTNFKEKVVKT